MHLFEGEVLEMRCGYRLAVFGVLLLASLKPCYTKKCENTSGMLFVTKNCAIDGN